MESTICRKSDLEWESHGILKSVPRAMFSLVKGKQAPQLSAYFSAKHLILISSTLAPALHL
jgi:hypothetical protein